MLNSIPSPDVSYVDIGIFRVHFYAIFILLGIVGAIFIADRRLVKRGATSGVAVDIALWTVPLGIIGARIFHVLTHPSDYFYAGADLLAVFYIWEGGIAIYGGLIGGAIGAWLGSRFSAIRFWSFADAVAPGLLLAQAIGRWGNYFNQELYGTPTELPWGLEIDSFNSAYPTGLPDGVLFHPTFLYESIWSLIGVALLLIADRKFELRWGKLFAIYLIYYSLGRIWVESLRIDPSEIILGLRTNVWSALLGIAVGVAIFVVQRRRHPGLESDVRLAKKSKNPIEIASDGLDSTEDSKP